MKALELLFVMLISTVLSIIGLYVIVRLTDLSFTTEDHKLELYYLTIFVSNVLWIPSYYIWIRKGINLKYRIIISIFLPFVGSCIVLNPVFGILSFITLFWMYIPISFIAVSALSYISIFAKRIRLNLNTYSNNAWFHI